MSHVNKIPHTHVDSPRLRKLVAFLTSRTASSADGNVNWRVGRFFVLKAAEVFRNEDDSGLNPDTAPRLDDGTLAFWWNEARWLSKAFYTGFDPKAPTAKAKTSVVRHRSDSDDDMEGAASSSAGQYKPFTKRGGRGKKGGGRWGGNKRDQQTQQQQTRSDWHQPRQYGGAQQFPQQQQQQPQHQQQYGFNPFAMPFPPSGYTLPTFPPAQAAGGSAAAGGSRGGRSGGRS